MMTEVQRTRSYRPLILLFALLIVLLLLLILFLLNRPCDKCDQVVVTPGGEEVVMGNTDPKEGDLTTPDPNLPTKGQDVPPIGGSAGDKPDTGSVEPGNPQDLVDRYGDQAKPETGDLPGVTDPTPKDEITPTPSDVSYGRLRFTITDAGELRPENLMSVEGDVQPPAVLMGDLLAVIYLDEQPVFYETFADPLVSIGFPQGDEGHSYGTQSEGTILLSLPPSLVGENRALANARIEIYRLGPTIPSDTPLTAENLPALVEQSTLFGSITGDEILRLLDSGEEIE
jgi:hypothetical protein